MKKRFKLQAGGAVTSAILLFALVLTPEVRKAGAWKIKELRRDKYNYPTSKTFLDVGGNPYPALEDQLSSQIFPGDKDILINQGYMPNDVSRVMPFQYLSPVIRMHPEESKFRMTWQILSTQGEWLYELNYDRDRGEVALTGTDFHQPSSTYTKLLGRYLTDRDIHEAGLDAAKNWTDFEEWVAKHWDH